MKINKILFISLLTSLIFNNSNIQNLFSKTVTTFEYDCGNKYILEECEKEFFEKYKILYDKGLKRKVSYMDLDGYYDYDGSFCVSIKTFEYDKKKLIKETSYGSDKQLLNQSNCEFGEEPTIIRYLYHNNNLSFENGYNYNGEISYQIKYSYDKDNNLIEKLFYNDSSIFSIHKSRSTYEYDLNGNIVNSKYFSFIEKLDKDSLNRETVYKYNSNNNLIEEIIYKSETMDIWGEKKIPPSEFKIIYKYDSDNNLIEEKTNRSTFYEYNSDGRLVQQLTDRRKITYEYNSTGDTSVVSTYYYSKKINDFQIRYKKLYDYKFLPIPTIRYKKKNN